MSHISIKTLLVLMLAVILTSCASTGLSDFGEIKMGMDKTDVLDELGSPQKSERTDGVDYWTYRFYENDEPVEREVQFTEGRVSYTGKVTKRKKGFPKNRKSRVRSLEDELKKDAPKKKKGNFKDI